MSATSQILIVDSSERSRQELCGLLSDCGAPLHCAQSYDEAQEWRRSGGLACAAVLRCSGDELEQARLFGVALRLDVRTVGTPLIVLTDVHGLQPFDDRTSVFGQSFDHDKLKELVCAATARCNPG